ncbi:class I poly(R)-hydroxyalkanoic acid synthase [Psychrobacter sp. I-STPA10]|uniref:class I poly(R)-hydroxyalkanoic acid synthase n=1 Tax=Psychrobacter sp. I-STPA10 TaxID=2585769 RepID=UPI001E2C293B|nr:class I poly(R)-hydroxyalkanoic acid synthase [Psychrobacter sp. I-STPA10]
MQDSEDSSSQNQTKESFNTTSQSNSSSEPDMNSDTTDDTFDINQLSQLYLQQLQQLNSLNQSYVEGLQQTQNPLEANIKLWQGSVDYFNQFFKPYTAAFDGLNPNSNSSSNPNFNAQQETEQATSSTAQATQAHSLNNPLESMNELSQKLLNETLYRVTQSSDTGQSLMFNLLDGWQKFTTGAMDNSPRLLIAQQTNFLQQQLHLWQNTIMQATGKNAPAVITPAKGDKRFADEEWSENPLFNYLKQNYLLTVDSMMDVIDNAKGIDDKTRQRLSFFTRQWLNAVAPSNFLWSNPEILRLTLESGGQNLITGLQQFTQDLEKSAQVLNISMTDKSAFQLGENIASTAGKVVFRNRMFELIQYTPTTDKVNKRPLLIVPPWINKFYIMDLKEKNSYIRWALNEGHSVFVISWVNPTRAYKDVGMETYMHEGLLTALDVIQEITGEPDANVIGYCIGGMLLALTLSWLTEHKQDKRIASATFWTTIFDFSDPGDLGVFIDERVVDALEQEEAHQGVFDGRLMGVAFSLLRENSLYWNYYIQNYLKGERPTPFDLLYWNSDCTNVTAALHSFVLRELYLGNKMVKRQQLSFDDIKVDLSKVTIPCYVVATLQDHIVKWQGSYQSTQVLGGDVTFVLGESGHVAGVINPPTGKYGFYTYDEYPVNPDDWFEKAQKQDKSWWLHWAEWIKQYGAGKVDAREAGIDFAGKPWTTLCDAPGEYVLVQAQDALNAVP